MKKQKLNSNTKKQMGTTNSVEGSKSPKVNADENIQRAVEILNEKEYEASYDASCIYNDNKATLIFSELVCKDSFHKLPKGLSSEPMDGAGLLLSFDIDYTADENKQSSVFTKASASLLKWAEKLQKAVFVIFEINVPFGEDQYDVMRIVEEELGLFDADVQHWEEDGEPDEELGDDLLYSLYVTPQMVKSWKRKLKAFEESNGFAAGMSWNVER